MTVVMLFREGAGLPAWDATEAAVAAPAGKSAAIGKSAMRAITAQKGTAAGTLTRLPSKADAHAGQASPAAHRMADRSTCNCGFTQAGEDLTSVLAAGGTRTAIVTGNATATATINAHTAQGTAEAAGTLPTMATGIIVSLSTAERRGTAAGTATERRRDGTTTTASWYMAAGMVVRSRGSRKQPTVRQHPHMARSVLQKGPHLHRVSTAVEHATACHAAQG